MLPLNESPCFPASDTNKSSVNILHELGKLFWLDSSVGNENVPRNASHILPINGDAFPRIVFIHRGSIGRNKGHPCSLTFKKWQPKPLPMAWQNTYVAVAVKHGIIIRLGPDFQIRWQIVRKILIKGVHRNRDMWYQSGCGDQNIESFSSKFPVVRISGGSDGTTRSMDINKIAAEPALSKLESSLVDRP